jgi:5-methylcytosine-specific restriction endonuclease McrA
MIISRADARAAGLGQYFTGVPCIHGHVAKRNVSNNRCAECVSLYAEAKGETIKAWQAEYRKAHPKPPVPRRPSMSREERLRRDRERCRKARSEGRWKPSKRDPVKLQEWNRRSYQKRKARVAENNKLWRIANPDRWREIRQANTRNRRAQQRSVGGRHSAADIAAIFKAQGGRCAYCREKIGKGKRHVDHIKPLSKGGTNDRRNLQITCASCNCSKSDKDPIEFARTVGLLI